MIPGQIAPFLLFGMVIGWPFLEAWITGDKREHHLLQRPRNAPTRTAFLAAMVTVYGLLWAAGGNDILAVLLHMNLNSITYFMRAAIFVIPPIVFYVTRRWCIGLQRPTTTGCCTATRPASSCGRPTAATASGTCRSAARGVHAHRAAPRRDLTPESETDENGVAAPGSRSQRIRAQAVAG